MTMINSSTPIPQLVQDKVSQINQVFVGFVGPIAHELSADVYSRWVGEGKFNASSLRKYIHALSEQLDNLSERQEFLRVAEKILLK